MVSDGLFKFVQLYADFMRTIPSIKEQRVAAVSKEHLSWSQCEAGRLP